jgi:hypothetical protein
LAEGVKDGTGAAHAAASMTTSRQPPTHGFGCRSVANLSEPEGRGWGRGRRASAQNRARNPRPRCQASAVAELVSERDESGGQFRPPAIGRMTQHPCPRRQHLCRALPNCRDRAGPHERHEPHQPVLAKRELDGPRSPIPEPIVRSGRVERNRVPEGDRCRVDAGLGQRPAQDRRRMLAEAVRREIGGVNGPFRVRFGSGQPRSFISVLREGPLLEVDAPPLHPRPRVVWGWAGVTIGACPRRHYVRWATRRRPHRTRGQR